MAFKGPVLALDLYGDVALRPCLDLDLLVPPADVERSERLLTAAGYSPGPLGGRSRRWRQRQGQRAFYRPDGAQVDLHWRLLPAYFTASSRVDSRAVPHTITLGGVAIRTLAPDSLLLQLSLHGTKHVWDRLKWIVDIARFVRRYEALDWDRMLYGARAAGTERMTLVGLWLARDLLEAKLPAAAVGRIDRDAVVATLGRQVSAQLFDRHDASSMTFWPPWRFNIRARERLTDKARCGLQLISALGLSDLPTAARRVLVPSADRPMSR